MRHCTVIAAALLASGSIHAQPKPNVIAVVGDSLSAEYGLKRGSGWVALLEKKLASEKIVAKVVNAAISGDTTSGGRSRLKALLATHKPTHVVIELGGNDALRGLPLSMTRANLEAMTDMVKATGAQVLLVGMQLPPNYGLAYGREFADAFATVAKSKQTGLVPFFLKGVADTQDPRQMFQSDGIHPTEVAHPIMLANVWPELHKQLKKPRP